MTARVAASPVESIAGALSLTPMTGRDARQECVSDNVDGYRSISHAHGFPSAVEDGVWTCRAVMPPYYSNAVTVSRSGVEAQLALVHELADAVAPPFTVKDSHALLDLAPLGFRVPSLRSGSGSRTKSDGRQRGPRRLATADHTRGPRALGGRMARARLTRDDPGLRPGVARGRIGGDPRAERDGEIVAGVAVNRSTQVVGLSNFFAAEPDADAQFADAVAAVRRSWPDLRSSGTRAASRSRERDERASGLPER